MREKEIGSYHTHLVVECRVARSTQNQALNAIIYLYNNILIIHLGEVKTLRPRDSKHLPTIHIPKELLKILSLLNGDSKLIVKILYGSGFKVSELLRLRGKGLESV